MNVAGHGWWLLTVAQHSQAGMKLEVIHAARDSAAGVRARPSADPAFRVAQAIAPIAKIISGASERPEPEMQGPERAAKANAETARVDMLPLD
jgi:hypothetical protein